MCRNASAIPRDVARNARPRDRHGRPLPRGAVGVERVPDDVVFGPDDGLPSPNASSTPDCRSPRTTCWRACGKAAPPAEREVWRALAQVAVGLTHAQRGNPRGAVALLRRAVDGLGRWVGPAPAGVDLDGVRAHADELARRIQGSGSAISPRPTCGSGCASDHSRKTQRLPDVERRGGGRYDDRSRQLVRVECGDVLLAERAELGYTYCTKDACQARHHRGAHRDGGRHEQGRGHPDRRRSRRGPATR